MKTTLEISDPLFKAAKAQARREGITLRALVERSLRAELKDRHTKKAYQLRDASVHGRGLQPASARLSWEQLRELSYDVSEE